MLASRLDDCAPKALPPTGYRLSATEHTKPSYKPFRRSKRLESALEKLREGDDFPRVPTYHVKEGEEFHPVGSNLRLDILQPSKQIRKEEEIEDSTKDRMNVEESREATTEYHEYETRQEGIRDQIMIETNQNSPHKTSAKSCFKQRNDSICKDRIASRMSSTIHVEASLSSGESGKETATYNAFTDSSDASDSSLDGYSTDSSTKNKKATTTDRNKEEKRPKAKSPIAKAGDFIHQLVNNFNFEAFVVPDRIKEHAKSQPIKTDICEELSLNLSEVSSLQGDVRTSHEKHKKQAIQQPQAFKTAMASPRRDFMSELRERLAERAEKSGPTKLRITERRGEIKANGSMAPRQTLKSQVAREKDTVVENIPALVSTDTLSKHKSSGYINHTSCNVFMGCLDGKSGIKNPSDRLNWHHSALTAIKDPEKTLADCEGQHGNRALSTSQGFQSHANSFGEEVINVAASGLLELSPMDPVDAIVGEKSDETEDDNESDAESMVPLKHGKREKVESHNGPRDASTVHRESMLESKEESLGFMMVSSDVAVEDEAVTSSPSKIVAGEESRLISRSCPPQTMRQFDEAHQKELRLRIKEFQERKIRGPATPISLVGSSLAGSSQRPPINLPTALRKIAQGYVDALTKKFVEEESGGYANFNSVVTLKPQDP